MKRTFIIASVVCVVVVGMIGVLPLLAQTPTPPPSRLDHDRGLIDLPRYPQAAAPMSSDHTPLAPNDMAAWSKLTYQSYIGNWDIFAANGDGSNPVRLTSSGAPDITPRFNRGATRVAYASSEPGNYEIFAMNANGSNRVRLTNQAANDYNPAWSPDGTKIVFNSYRDGQSEIYVMNADGSNPVRLTNAAGYDGQPAWSPDGTKIAFVSDRAGGSRIWVMNANGSGATRLTTVPYSEDPAWSPDGTKIAFDADSEGDGWQELMVVNTDGTNVHVIGDMGNAADMWARSWSPDGRSVAFTAIYYIYYQGNWYWTAAYSFAADTVAGGAYSLGGSDTDWFPDWQTTDVLPPTSSMMALPATSPAPIAVKWSGVDAGPAGILGYDVQVKDGAGAWTMWLTRTAQTSASYPGVGGHTYSFRVRALDNSNNAQAWPASAQASTTVEALPPISAISPLPMYYRGELPVSWSSSDPGGSSIQSYDVQYRDGITGTWTGWLNNTGLTTAAFTGEAGHAYSFRVRATDRAQNVGAWTQLPNEAATLLYARLLNGTVFDSRGRIIVGAAVNLWPSALTPITSTARGYIGYLDADGARVVTVTQPLFGQTPPMTPALMVDTTLDHWLPPLDNVIQNGDFESALVTETWQISGNPLPALTTAEHHSGQSAVQLGQTLAFAEPQTAWPGLGFPTAVALDDDQVLHAVWSVPIDGIGHTVLQYAAQPLTSTAVVTPTTILTIEQPLHNAYYVSITPDGAGGIHVGAQLWRNDWNIDIVYCHKAAASPTCDTPILLETYSLNDGLVDRPEITTDRHGGVHLIWTTVIVRYAYRSPAGQWSQPRSISQGAGLSPRIAVDGRDVVHAVWVDGGGGVYWEAHAYYTTRSLTGDWQLPTLAYSINGGLCYHIDLAVSQAGVAHVLLKTVWSTNVYGRLSPGGTWSAPQGFGSTIDIPSALELDPYGRPYVLSPNGDAIEYHALTPNNQWVHLADLPRRGVWEYHAVVDGAGRLHIFVAVQPMHSWLDWSATASDYSLTQSLSIPVGRHAPTMSLLYLVHESMDNRNTLHLQITDANTTTEVIAVSPVIDRWAQAWADVSRWAGRTVTLTLQWHQAIGSPFYAVYLDEVSLGSWLTPDPQTITPNRIEANASAVITIAGDNFIDPPQVRLNDVPLPDAHWVNTNTITATVPALPNGRYDVIVINPGGQASGVPYGLTVGRLAFLPMLLK